MSAKKKIKKTKKTSLKKRVAKKVKKTAIKKKKVAVKKTSLKKRVAKKVKKTAVKKKKKMTVKKTSLKKGVAKKAKKAVVKKKKVAVKKTSLKKGVAKKLGIQKTIPKKKGDAKKLGIQKAIPKKKGDQKNKEIGLKKTQVVKSRVPVKLAAREKELETILDKEKENKQVLRDIQGRSYCLVESCDFPSVVEGYCRLHYFAGWKVILQRKKLLEENFLEKIFLQFLTKHSGAILEYLFKDLNSDKNFSSVMKKIEDNGDFDIEDEGLLYLLDE